MLLVILALSLLITFIDARIYKVQISVNDNTEWTKYNNASVYFVLTTNLNGDIKTSPAYVLQDGLPGTDTYTYSFLLDDIGTPETLRIFHSDSNKLCVNWISIDAQNASHPYDCATDTYTYFECQQIEAYFDSGKILHAPDVFGCKWENIVSHTLMKQYNIEITMDSSYPDWFYNKIGLVLQGFVFDSYLTPYYHLSLLSNELFTVDTVQDHDRLQIDMVTYDVTPLQSIWIATQNIDDLCVNSITISVTNEAIMNVSKTFNTAQCISYAYSESDEMTPNGCQVLSVDFRKDKSAIESQPECDVTQTSFEYNANHRSATAQYTLFMNVSEGTDDYIFYQMEGYSGDRTECFYITKHQLPLGLSVHQYTAMKNIGNPKKLYLLHDRNDDICMSYIKIHNGRTNDTIRHEELMCSHFLYDGTEPGQCNVITIDFETNMVTNVVSVDCPFAQLCQFGLYEASISSNGLSAYASSVALLIVFISLFIMLLLSFVFGFQCLYCHSVYSCLIHCWDPFANGCWNPRFEEKCFRCSNTTDMQHNLCCYCCGCDYCNPFGIHRRRMDKRNKNEIARERRRRKKNKTGIDEYDTDDGDALNLTTTAGKYDMDDMDQIDLGSGIAGNGHLKKALKTKYSSPSLSTDDEEDDLADFGDTFGDSDSTSLQVKKVRVEDAPINIRMHEDDEDERLKSGVIDEYDAGLR